MQTDMTDRDPRDIHTNIYFRISLNELKVAFKEDQYMCSRKLFSHSLPRYYFFLNKMCNQLELILRTW